MEMANFVRSLEQSVRNVCASAIQSVGLLCHSAKMWELCCSIFHLMMQAIAINGNNLDFIRLFWCSFSSSFPSVFGVVFVTLLNPALVSVSVCVCRNNDSCKQFTPIAETNERTSVIWQVPVVKMNGIFCNDFCLPNAPHTKAKKSSSTMLAGHCMRRTNYYVTLCGLWRVCLCVCEWGSEKLVDQNTHVLCTSYSSRKAILDAWVQNWSEWCACLISS